MIAACTPEHHAEAMKLFKEGKLLGQHTLRDAYNDAVLAHAIAKENNDLEEARNQEWLAVVYWEYRRILDLNKRFLALYKYKGNGEYAMPYKASWLVSDSPGGLWELFLEAETAHLTLKR